MKQQEMLNKLRSTIANDKTHLLNIRSSSEHKTKQVKLHVFLMCNLKLVNVSIHVRCVYAIYY